MSNRISLLVIVLLLFVSSVFGQMSQGGTPISFNENLVLSSVVPRHIMPLLEQHQIDAIKEKNKQQTEAFQFAYGAEVNINLKSVAVSDELGYGTLYRYRVRSSGAKSINLIFSTYRLPHGATLFIYSSDHQHVLGAFTSNNNKESGRLATLPVRGEEVTIEYFEPFQPDFEGDVVVGKVSHDFIGFQMEDDDYGASGNCQVDVNCTEGDNWQIEKRAVCKILLNGVGHCSGALINNVNYDGKAYFLTAYHCINNNTDADDAVFVFNYESPSCNGPDGSTSKSIAGSVIRAKRESTDFALLELSKRPFTSYNPYYAGWDRTNVQDAGGVGISHPGGDVKKIATHSMIPDDSDCLGSSPSSTYSNQDFWQINAWDQTTNGHAVMEGGSSGSPLFNSNHKVIGQLFGGCDHDPDCADPTNDFANYGKIHASWDGSASDSRLRDWLDPENTVTSLGGTGLCGPGVVNHINLTHTITATELHQAIKTIGATNTVVYGATATYKAGETIDLWPGFMANSNSDFLAEVQPFDCIEGCFEMELNGWTSIVCDGGNLCYIIENATTYDAKITTTSGALVHQSSGAVTGNTVCVWNPVGYAAGTYFVKMVFDNPCQNLSSTYPIQLINCNKQPSPPKEGALDINYVATRFDVFPNPANGTFTLVFSEQGVDQYGFQIMNALGKVVYSEDRVHSSEVNVDISRFPKGIYYISILTETSIKSKKLVVN